jgi:hypothetical protein
MSRSSKRSTSRLILFLLENRSICQNRHFFRNLRSSLCFRLGLKGDAHHESGAYYVVGERTSCDDPVDFGLENAVICFSGSRDCFSAEIQGKG